MSTESAVVLIVIVLAFLVFGATLASIDVYANRGRTTRG